MYRVVSVCRVGLLLESIRIHREIELYFAALIFINKQKIPDFHANIKLRIIGNQELEHSNFISFFLQRL